MLHISATNGKSSGRNSFSAFVGRGLRFHDFDGALVFLMSSTVTGLSVSKFFIIGGKDD